MIKCELERYGIVVDCFRAEEDWLVNVKVQNRTFDIDVGCFRTEEIWIVIE